MSDFKIVSVLNPTVVLTAGPAISAGTQSQNTGTVSFGNSPTITFGLNNGTLTASVVAGAAAGIAALGAGTNTNTSGTIIFGSSAGNVTFGMSPAGYVTAAVPTNYAATDITTNAVALSNSSLFQQTSNTSNITSAAQHTSNNSLFQYTSATSAITSNAFPSANTTKFAGTGTSATNASITLNSNGLAISVASPSAGGVAIAAGGSTYTNGTVPFGNANGFSFITSNGSIVGSYTDGGGAGGDGNNVLGVNGGATQLSTTYQLSNANNVSFGLNAGTITATASYPAQTAFVFSNANGVSFGTNASTVTATVKTDYLTTARASNDAIGLNTALTANGLSVTANSSGLSINVPAYLTTAMVSNAGSNFVGLNSALTANGVSASINSSGISLNFPAFLTTAMQSQMTSNYMSTAERNNYFYTSNNTFANNTHSHGNPTLALTNLTGTTASASNGFTLSLSAAAPGAGGGVALANSQTTYTSGTASFMAGGGAITIASNTGQRFDFSVPATSSISVTGVLSMSVNGNTISLGAPAAAADGINVVMLGTTGTTGTAYSNSTGTVYLNGTGPIIVSQNNSNQIVISYSGGTDVEGVSLIGNVAGNSTVAPSTNGTIYLSGGNNVTLSGTGNTVVVSAAAGGAGADVTFLTYQNRQLGASASTQFTNNQIWLVPFRVAGGYVSASTGQYIQSLGGTYTSAVAATHAETMNWCLYSNNTTNSTRLDTWASGQFTWQVWNSGTSSGSYAMNGSTSSSAGTGIFTQISGVRNMQVPFGSSVPPGLYVLAFRQSTSSAGYSALLSRYGVVVDSPMPLAVGNGFGGAAATSIGYVDAGTYSVTSTAFPASIGLSEIRQHSNIVPYFKMGAI